MPKRTLKASGRGYDFSTSFEQTRRVRFNFGVRGSQSLAVDATLAKLFESLTMECRWRDVAFLSKRRGKITPRVLRLAVV